LFAGSIPALPAFYTDAKFLRIGSISRRFEAHGFALKRTGPAGRSSSQPLTRRQEKT
jgi:hypothetical protein